jgi:hypothetical protein
MGFLQGNLSFHFAKMFGLKSPTAGKKIMKADPYNCLLLCYTELLFLSIRDNISIIFILLLVPRRGGMDVYPE